MFQGFKVLAVVVMAALAFVPMAVEATPYASSTLLVTNADFDGPAFSTFFFRENQTSATLNGVTVNSPSNLTAFAPTGLDQPISCVGNCGSFVNNVFFPSPGVNVVAGSYAISDSHMLVNAINPPDATAAGTWGSRTQAQLNTGTVGSAQTGTDNTLQWNFTISSQIGSANDIALDFDLTRNFHIHTDALGEFASASSNILVQILREDGTVLLTLLDLTISNSISQLSGAEDLFSQNDATIHEALVANDLANGIYSLLIRFGTSADVGKAAVPEPATLTLLGLGLVSAAYVSRRRRS
jgi:hypothetical protein